jgi:hypothetical protein
MGIIRDLLRQNSERKQKQTESQLAGYNALLALPPQMVPQETKEWAIDNIMQLSGVEGKGGKKDDHPSPFRSILSKLAGLNPVPSPQKPVGQRPAHLLNTPEQAQAYQDQEAGAKRTRDTADLAAKQAQDRQNFEESTPAYAKRAGDEEAARVKANPPRPAAPTKFSPGEGYLDPSGKVNVPIPAAPRPAAQPMKFSPGQGYMDPVTGKVRIPIPKKEEGAGDDLYSGVAPVQNLAPGQRDESVLKGHPQGIVDLVKGLVDYAIPLPGGFALANPKSPWNKALGLARHYDPTFDASQYQTRMALKKDFMSGKAAGFIRSLNTTAQHLDELYKTAGDLGNSTFQTYNKISNWLSRQAGSPKVTNFNNARAAVVGELSTLFKGTATEGEIKRWEQEINDSESPEQLKGALSTIAELIQGRINALREQYENGMGRPFTMRVLTPQAARILRKLGGGTGGESGAPAADETPEGVPKIGDSFGGGKVLKIEKIQ